MNYFIPPEIIKNILDSTNIIQLINSRIKLKKIGKNYYSICPFHYEKTPSFIINEEKQYFHCFGCHEHGNIIDFLMKYDKLTFLESIKEISNIFNISIPHKQQNKKINIQYKKNNILYNTTKYASIIYHKNLLSIKCHQAQLYLKQRNINLNMIQYFQIGFSTPNCLIMKNDYYLNQKYKSNLIQSGILCLNKNNNIYDRFNDRIILPIKNKYGKITGFGGRTINNQFPKYINSPKTNIFNKSNELYGIYQIYKICPKPKYIIVVEGYFDVISLTQFNIKYTVSTLSTMITKSQIQSIFNMTNNIIYCYDGDKSGIKAAWRTLKISLQYMYNRRNIKFIFLPEKEDPDSIIHKEGKKNFKKRIKNAINILDFFFNKLFDKKKLYSLNSKIDLIHKAIPLINTIPDKFIRIYTKKTLGIKIGILDQYQLYQLFHETQNNKKNYNIQPTNVHILISLILQTPSIHKIIPCSINELKKIKIPGVSLFIEIFLLCQKYNHITTGQIIEFYRRKKKFFNIVNKLAWWNNMIDYHKKEKVFIDLIKKIYNIALEKKYHTLIIKDRMIGLKKTEKNMIWKINQNLSKK